MGKYVLRLPGGGELTAIGSLSITWQVNDGTDISLGSACAAMLEATLFEEAEIAPGTELTCLEDGKALGIFQCEQPHRTGRKRLSITAYDRMILFDREISPWMESRRFPTTAQRLLEDLCAFCGVEFGGEALPEFSVEAFSQPGITGRQLLQYLGQAAGRFFTVNAEGILESRWYTPSEKTLGEDIPISMGTLTCGGYTTAPIQRVLIRSTATEVGAVWPDGTADTANTCILQGNPLLPPGAQRQAVAQRLYQQLKDYACTPFSCTLLSGGDIAPGQIVSFLDAAGQRHTAPVMELKLQNGKRTVSATGSAALQSTTAFNRLALDGLPGRMLTVERTAEGLKAENTDIRGNAAALALTVDGITTRVSAAEEKAGDYATKGQLSVLEQRADGLSLSVTQLQSKADTKADKDQLAEVTEHFRFASDGLTITNSATGMGIHVSEEVVAFTGGSAATTVITPNAMETTNLDVATRLDLGPFSLIPRTNGNLSLRYTAK